MEKEFGCFHSVKKNVTQKKNQILKRNAKVTDLRQTTGMLRIEKERGFQMWFLVQTLDRKEKPNETEERKKEHSTDLSELTGTLATGRQRKERGSAI